MEYKEEHLIEKQSFDTKSIKGEDIILVKNEGEIKKEASELLEDTGAVLNNEIEIKKERSQLQKVPEEIEIKEEPSQKESRGILECTFHKKIARRHYICLKCTCSKKFLNKVAVYSHIRTDHYGLKYKCRKCNKIVSESQLKPHLEDIHQIYVPNANDDAALNNAAESHFEISFVYAYREYFEKLPNNNYICVKCARRRYPQFDSKETVLRHIRSKHQFTYTCPKCPGRQFNSSYNLSEHLVKEHLISVSNFKPDVIIYDDECDYDDVGAEQEIPSDLDEDELLQLENKLISKISYKESYKKIGHGNYICIKCTKNGKRKRYHSKPSVFSHIRCLHFGFRYICKLCSKVYYARITVNNHLNKVHGVYDITSRHNNTIIKRLTESEINELENEAYSKIVQPGMERKIPKNDNAMKNIQTNNTEAIGVKQEIPFDLDKDELLQLENKLISTVSYKNTYTKIGPDNYICVKCTKNGKQNRYCSRSSVICHIKYHHFGFRYICKLCSKVYNSRPHVNKHLNKVHEAYDITSRHNNTIIKILTESEINELENQEYSKIVQPEIEQIIPQKDNVKKNIQTHKRIANNHYICLQCNDSEKFENLKSLNIHRRLYHKTHKNNSYMMLGEDHYICLLCKNSQRFKNTIAIYNHRKKYHRNAIKVYPNQKYIHSDNDNGNNEAMLLFIEKEEPQIEYEHVATIGSSVLNDLSSVTNQAMLAEHTKQEEISDIIHCQSEIKKSHVDIKYDYKNVQHSGKQIKLENEEEVHNNLNYEATMGKTSLHDYTNETTVMASEIVIKQEMPFNNCNNATTTIVADKLMATDAFIKQESPEHPVFE